MMSVDEELEILARAVRAEAQSEAQRILAEARAKAKAIEQEAQQQAQAECEDILAHARQEAERLHKQALAAVQLQVRRLLLQRREELLQRVLEAVQEELPTVTARANYEQLLRQWLEEAIAYLGGTGFCIRADPKTQEVLSNNLLAELGQKLGVQLQLGETLPHETGVIVESSDGRRQYDNTLEARLSRGWGSLRAAVYRLLEGDSQ